MKLLVSFCFLITLLLSEWAFGQSETPRFRDMVIEVQGIDAEKRLPALQQQLLQSGDIVRVEAFCADQGWVLLRITEEAIVNNEQVEQLFKPLGLSFLIKTGATRKEFNAACKGGLIHF
jgi:hypothetical protein